MTRIAPVRLAYNPKVLWFDARDLELEVDQPVVVLTARGIEFGTVAEPVLEATDEQVANLKSPLKPVKRVATEEDIAQAEEMKRLSEEALPIFRELAAEANEDMRPVSVEYLLDGDKAVFYFEAEDRVDFRDLVRKLAARFHVRIDMRQIGVRDEARMVGGLGHCGQELCCKRLGGEFCPVSIRMAKEQDLSLNPQKISGVCGRLMCCLRYEYEAYKDFKSRAPKQNATVNTPEGPAKVASLDVPREVVELKTEEGKTVRVPLADFEPAEGEGIRPNTVGQVAWDEANSPAAIASMPETAYLTSHFTTQDKIGTAKATRSGGDSSQDPRMQKKKSQSEASSGRSRKQTASTAPSEDSRSRRRRRSTKVDGDTVTTVAVEPAAAKPARRSRRTATTVQTGSAASTEKQQVQKGGGQKQRSPRGGQPADRSAKPGAKAQNQKQNEGKRNSGKQSASNQGKQQPGTEKRPAQRPGQKSSGIRRPQQAKPADQNNRGADAASPQNANANANRKPRRRTHRSGSEPQKGATNEE